MEKLVDGICYGRNYFLRDIYSDAQSLDTRFFAMDVVSYNLILRRCYERVNDYDMSYERVFFPIVAGTLFSILLLSAFRRSFVGRGNKLWCRTQVEIVFF